MELNLGNDIETDDRFPTGEWVGFWLQRPHVAGRQAMELSLAFALGKVYGSGSDCVGEFAMRGRYEVDSGKVTIQKQYTGAHRVLYEGWAEGGKGIWGVWKIPEVGKDGFHIWPKGMRDPSQGLAVAEKAPAEEGPAVLVDSSALSAE